MEAANEKKSTNHRFLLLRLAMVLCDVLSVNLAYFIALVVRFYVNFEFNAWATRYVPAFFEFAPFYTLACIVIFGCFKLYNSRWRYAGLGDLNRIIVASLITCVVQVVGSCMFVLRMPITYYFIGALLQFALVTATRFAYRIILLEIERAKARRNRKETAVKVMVVGVGETANVILKHMERDVDNAAQPVCCVDFRSEGFGDMMGGLPVVGGVEKIPEAIQKYSVENVILADNTMPLSVRKQVRSICEKAQVEVQDFGGYFQEGRGPVTLRGLMECTKGQVELVMNGNHKCFVNGEQAMEYVTEKSVLKSVSAKDNRLVVELQKDILVPNDVKEDWVRNYEKESGEDISFF